MYRHQGGGMTPGMALTMVGQQLANALSQKWQRKAHHDKMMGLAQSMGLDKDVTGEEMPGYEQETSLLDALIPQAPLDPAKAMSAPLDPSKMPEQEQLPTYMEARGQLDETAGAWAAGENKSRGVLREMLTSGNPQLEQMAMSRIMPAPRKPMSVTGGYLDEKGRFVRTERGGYEIKQGKDGTVLGIDPQSLETVVLYKGDPENKVQVTTTGTQDGGEIRTLLVTDKQGNVVEMMALGDTLPERGTKVNIDTGDKPNLESDEVWNRQMVNAISEAQGAVRRVERIEQVFDPFFQSAGGQAATWSLALLDRLLPKGLPEGSAKDLLAAKTSFAQYTNENMNLYIKMITGAQMSEAEAGRLSKAIANLGDSPTEFATKLANSKKVLQEAADIYAEELEFYTGKGLTFKRAKELAGERSANHIRMGMGGLNLDAMVAGYDAQFGGADDGWEQR